MADNQTKREGGSAIESTRGLMKWRGRRHGGEGLTGQSRARTEEFTVHRDVIHGCRGGGEEGADVTGNGAEGLWSGGVCLGMSGAVGFFPRLREKKHIHAVERCGCGAQMMAWPLLRLGRAWGVNGGGGSPGAKGHRHRRRITPDTQRRIQGSTKETRGPRFGQ